MNLIEPEVALKTLDESNITDIADEIGEIASELDVSLATDKSGYNSTRLLQESGSTNENEELERSYCLNESEEADLVVLQSQVSSMFTLSIDSLYLTKSF